MAVQGSQVIAVEWTMITITLLLVLLRLYLRCFVRKTWSYADILVVVGWCFFTVQAGLDTRLWKLGLFRPDIRPGGPDINIQEKLPPRDVVEVFKLQYTQNAIYYLSMYCMKGAMLILFYTLVPRSMKKTWRFLLFTTIFTVVGILVSTPLNLFYCLPVSRNWTLNKNDFCASGDAAVAGSITIAFHIFSDLFIYITPFPVIRQLDLSRKQKFGVGAIFASGFLCIAFAIAVILAYVLGASSAASDFFTMWEQSWAIVVVCSPAFKAFLTTDVRRWWERGSGGSGDRDRDINSDPGTDGSKKEDDDGIIEILPRRSTASDTEAGRVDEGKFKVENTIKGKSVAKRKEDSDEEEKETVEVVDDLNMLHRRPSQREKDRNRKSTFTVKSSYSIGKGSQVGEIPIMMDVEDFDVPLPLPSHLQRYREEKPRGDAWMTRYEP